MAKVANAILLADIFRRVVLFTDNLGDKVKTIDKRKAKSLLRQVVKGKEDHIVDFCSYYLDDENGNLVPNCIVGAAFHAFDPEILEEIEENRANYVKVYKVNDSIGTFCLTKGAIEVFQAAQDWQDGNKDYEARILAKAPWGFAVQKALEV